MRYIGTRGRGNRFVGAGMAVASLLITATFVWANRSDSERDEADARKHKVIMPTIVPTSQSPCAQAAVIYAVAIVELENAQAAADAAYEAWYECEFGEPPTGEGGKTLEHTVSILER